MTGLLALFSMSTTSFSPPLTLRLTPQEEAVALGTLICRFSWISKIPVGLCLFYLVRI